jgi:hypothetical protein
VNFEKLPMEVRLAFEELRTVRAMTGSTVLTLSACDTLCRESEAVGFSRDQAMELALRAVELGDKDARR